MSAAQGELFGAAPSPSKRRRPPRPGWERLSHPDASKTAAHWLHVASDWRVAHCGHMTANWPLYAVDPEFPWCATMTHNGRGWRRIADAMQAVEWVLAGQAVATDDRCDRGTRRIITPADPEWARFKRWLELEAASRREAGGRT